MATVRGIPLSKVSPAFLHANSTSHTWVFSAFAELIDNAYDPDVSASELLIDHIEIRGLPCLIFLDNGAGMDRDHLLKMLSFGFCEKEIYEKQGSHQPIGHYGNGFKSGSMRIGQDALVFTRCQKSACIGFLSQTYLTAMQSDSVVVPILEYRLPSLERIKSQESRNNLNAILEYSVFRMEHELKEELKALEGSKTGTKVIISNLKRLQDSHYELDFASDPTDIRCPEAHEVDMTSVYHRPVQQYTSEYKCSLREYCSILFLRPRMKITIRGIRVKSKLISKSLSKTEIDMYKPTWLSRPVKIIFGFTCEKGKQDDSDYGMMLYHRNRLIKAFEKVGYQKQPNGLGVGVVGVAQVDFLQPIHNKQDFNKDEKFHSVMAAFSNKLNDYWNEKTGSNAPPSAQSARNHPDWLWAQCDHCLKWRRLPDNIHSDSLPELWYCRMNPDATHNRCDIPEEPEDEDLAVKPTYEKTFKRRQEERKRLQQMEKEKEEEAKRRKIMEKERELKEKEAALRAIQQVAAAQPLQENKTVMSLKQALAEARRKEEQQKRLILQMQEQKKAMEEQRNSLLQMAETFHSIQGKERKDMLEEMSKIIGTLSSDSLTSASMLLGKRKPNEETSPAASKKGGKKMCIKTETGEMLSITQNDDDSDDNEITDNSPPVPQSKKRTHGQKENASPGEVDREAEQTLPNSASKPSQVSPPVAGSVKTASSKRGKPTSQSLMQMIGAATANISKEPSLSSSSKSQSQQKDSVMAVIDLTSDSEFGELVDIKPDLDGLHNSVLENIQQNEDIKPDKDALDETLRRKDDSKKPTASVPTLTETKQEMAETPLQDASAALPATHSEGEPIYFQPINGSPEFSVDMPEDAEDNLNTAIPVQARVEADMQELKQRSIVSQNGVTTVTNNTQDVEGEGQTLDAENSTVIDNAGDGSDFDGALDDDDSDYRAYSTVDEKGDSNESHIDRRHCAVTKKSRSNSTEDGSGSSNQGVSDDGFSVGKRNHTSSSHLKDSKQVAEISHSLAEEHASLDCHESSRGEYESETREENDSPDLAQDKGIVEAVSPGNLLDAHSFSKFSPNQEDSVPSKTFSAFENIDSSAIAYEVINNSAVVYEAIDNSAVVYENNNRSCEDSNIPSKDNTDKCHNEPAENEVQTVCTQQALQSDNGRLSLHPSSLTCEHSIDIKHVGTCENHMAENSLNQIDMVFSDTVEHVEQLHCVSSLPKSQGLCSSPSPLQNPSSPGDVSDCNMNRTHDENVQTDLDMLAIGEIFELHQSTGHVGKLYNHVSHVKDNKLSGVETTDKSFQTSVLEHNVSIAESQTEDSEWMRISSDQAEMVEELQTKLSLRSQQLEDTEKRLTEINVNIHKLLGYIVPGTELGDVNNIDQIIKDMIRIHDESCQETQSQEAITEVQSQDDTSLS